MKMPNIGRILRNAARWAAGPAERPRAVMNAAAEPYNVAATSLTVSALQGYCREAEAGDTRQLFALYRDIALGHAHTQAEFSKRKLAVLARPMTLLPASEEPDDLAAAAACGRAVADCENWHQGLVHLLDSTLWPLAVCEKVFGPAAGPARLEDGAEVGLQYTLKRLHPVNHALECYRQTGWARSGEAGQDTEAWEAGLRFYETDEAGNILWGQDRTYAADPGRHVVHRGHLLTSIQDCWGGPMRGVLFWWFLASRGRDWFGRAMGRYGAPFVVAKADMKDKDLKTMLEEALQTATKIFGLLVPTEAQVELKEAAVAGMADGYATFLNICHREISTIILGQTLSASAQGTGLGSGVAELHGEVREDYRLFDCELLAGTLQRQLFKQFLEINGLRGRPPRPVWGGEEAERSRETSALLVNLSQAGFGPTDEALAMLGERIGFPIERAARGAGISGGFAGPFGMRAMGAGALAAGGHPTDRVAAARAAALEAAYRGTMAPFRQAVLAAGSREEALENLRALYKDWSLERLANELDIGLQICAAAGAAAAADEAGARGTGGGEGRGRK